MPVSCPFQGCKVQLRIIKWLYIKYHAFAFFIAELRASTQQQNLVVAEKNYENGNYWGGYLHCEIIQCHCEDAQPYCIIQLG